MEPGLAVVKLDIRTDDYECRLRVGSGRSARRTAARRDAAVHEAGNGHNQPVTER